MNAIIPNILLLAVLLSSLTSVVAVPHADITARRHHRAFLTSRAVRDADGLTRERRSNEGPHLDHDAPVLVAGLPADVRMLPSQTSSLAVPLLVDSPSATASSAHAVPTQFKLLLNPPQIKKALTRVCTRRPTSTSTSSTTTSVTTTETTAMPTATKTKSKTSTTRTSCSTSTSKTPSATPGSKPFVAAYYPDWTGNQLPPESVDFDRFDWVDFAFAVPNSAFDLSFTDDDSEDLLKRLVSAAHAKNKKVKLSVGGWTGSKYFSSAVSSNTNRQTFAKNILKVYNKFNIDGIDIDWEYPGLEGESGNIVSSSDSSNYLSFLKLLRATLPDGAVITAATQVWPFAGSNGQPLKGVSEFAKYFDWILMMNYDVWGSSSTPGPNAPLSNACHNSSQPLANAQEAVKSWTEAGMPPEKITLGVPSYGYISRSNAQHLTGRGPSIKNEDGGTNDGQVQFNGLIAQGALEKKDGAYVGGGGFQRKWDSCSSTPFLRSASSGQVITYDDPESLQLKAAFAKKTGIKGVNMFDAHGDTADWELVDSLRRGLGIIE